MEIKLHDIGEGMTEGEVLQYFVKVGDKVKADQPLVEVQTDKMTAEIPAPQSGIVQEIVVEPGTTVAIGTTLLIMEAKESNKVVKEKPSTFHIVQMPTLLHQEHPQKKHQHQPILAAPYTRKIAREHGISLEEINGTGPAGRITDEDVFLYIESLKHNKGNETKKEAVQSFILDKNEKVVKQEQSINQATSETVADEIPFRGRRKQIAKKMVQSKFTIPHVTHFDEVDMTELLAYREQLKEMDVPISVAAFFVKALQLALKEYPIFNAKLDEEKEVIRLEKTYNIGLATDTEDGLIVPVIHHVERKSLKIIHQEMKNLIEMAKNDELTSKNLQDGTFTISNVGPFGSIGATPIVNYPEVALIAFHQTKEVPAVRNKEIVIRSMMNISMSFDHRVADGLTAVKFTNYFKKLIENPKLLLLELI
ncbi:dihydrolipoamide acetyltransferase family protein [Bacillus kwashiorkori]|uniref:dihydrolipoamide acetyltransferase family protein n=1 Tax=Bacillus kwashiorkori TaxID=1522318 RepID=UPI00078387B0|nr:dihydrolipoamide acetyltransferase family protein [Bacillus kwashiorkori]